MFYIIYIYSILQKTFRNIGGTFRERRGVSECESTERARECKDRGERETRAGKKREVERREGPFTACFPSSYGRTGK